MAALANSILDDIKKLLDLDPDYTAFDLNIVLFINSAFATLNDIGVGPTETYSIDDKTNLWAEFFGLRADNKDVKTYIFLKVQMVFDPPTQSYVLTAKQEVLKEIEWRLQARNDRYVSPNAYSAENPPPGFWWEINDAEGFPEEAAIGDLGFDPITGTVWRKTA